MALDQTQHSMPRKNLDLESALDIVSQDDQKQLDQPLHIQLQLAQQVTDPLVAAAEKDYRTRTHIEQSKTMENMMQKKRRLIQQEELPAIHFSMRKKDLAEDDLKQIEKRGPFFNSYFDQNKVMAGNKYPDLEKKLIVQT